LYVRQESVAPCVRASRAALGGQDPRSGLATDSRRRKSSMTSFPREYASAWQARAETEK
jgi:hypothetical protein